MGCKSTGAPGRAYRRDTGVAAESQVYAAPDPEKLLHLSETHGWDAVHGRWHWLSHSSLHAIAAVGRQRRRAKAGVIVRSRKRPITPEQEEAVVADVYALGGVEPACVKYGLLHGFVVTLLRERGHEDWPRIPHTERSPGARRARLALVHSAPLAEDAPIQTSPVRESEPMANAVQVVAARARASRIPDDATIRRDFERLRSGAKVAALYGLTYSGLWPKLRDLGLTRASRTPEVQSPAAVAPPPKPIPGIPEALQGIDRLVVEDLVLAVRLAREAGCEPHLAVEIVRADRDCSVLRSAGRA